MRLDGMISAVAGVAVEHDVLLVVVPCGTRNHFAKDCGADITNPAGHLAVIDDGHEVRVDVGTVNGERTIRYRKAGERHVRPRALRLLQPSRNEPLDRQFSLRW
jgi:hypothetical protein